MSDINKDLLILISKAQKYENFNILIQSNDIKSNLKDVMNTFSNHIAYQLIKNINGRKNKILVTGGGAYNEYLIEKIKLHDNNKNDWIIPNDNLVNYKEALIFAFMGLLKRMNKQILTIIIYAIE